MAPVLRREAAAVRAPNHFVPDMSADSAAHGVEYGRLFRRGGCAGLRRVMNQRMHLFADEHGRRLVAEETSAGGVTERAYAAQVYAVDRLCRGDRQSVVDGT